MNSKLILPYTTQQPQQAGGINWANPITRGMVASISGATGLWDAVNGRNWGVLSGSVGTAATAKGRGLKGVMRLQSCVNPVTTDFTSLHLLRGDMADFSAQGKFLSGWQNVDLRVFGTSLYFSTSGGTNYWGGTLDTKGTTQVCAVGRSKGTQFVPWYNGIPNTPTESDGVCANGPIVMMDGQWITGYPFTGSSVLNLFWNRALSDAEIASISANPWQVFATQSLSHSLPLLAGFAPSSGGVTRVCNVGTAAGQGVAAFLPTSLVCGIGSANAQGVSAQTRVNTALVCSVGTASAQGMAATLGAAKTLTCSVGAAAGQGVGAALGASVSLTCSMGASSAQGVPAILFRPDPLICNVAAASATGVNAVVGSFTNAGSVLGAVRRTRSSSKQPQQSGGIDWANPITLGLVASSSAALGLYDPVRGVPWSLQSDMPHTVATDQGLGFHGASHLAAYVPAFTDAMSSVYILRTDLDYNNPDDGQAVAGWDSTGLWVYDNDLMVWAPNWDIVWLYTSLDGTTKTVSTRYRGGDEFTVWLNGQFVGQLTGIVRPPPSDPLMLMDYGSGGYPFAGTSVLNLFWNRALSDAEIASINANPWQVFTAYAQTLFSAPAGMGSSLVCSGAAANATGVPAVAGNFVNGVSLAGSVRHPGWASMQPQQAGGIHWANPITAGLISSVSGATGLWDAVLGQNWVATTGTPSPAQSVQGLGISGAQQIQPPVPLLTSSVTPDFTSLTLFVSGPSTAGTDFVFFLKGNFISTGAGFLCVNTPQGNIYKGSMGVNQPACVVQTFRLSTHTLAGYLNGVGSWSHSCVFGTGTAPQSLMGNGSYPFSGALTLNLLWNRVLSDAEIASITANPWQVFAASSRPLLIPSSGGQTPTLVCSVGNASALGVPGILNAAQSVLCPPATAQASGLGAILSAPRILVCNVGQTQAVGVLCAVNGAVVRGCPPAVATASGVQSMLNAPRILSCNPATAQASGVGEVNNAARQLVCGPGVSQAAGVPCVENAARSVACPPAAATASGVTCLFSAARTLACNPALSQAQGVGAQTNAQRTVICNPGAAQALGVSCAQSAPRAIACPPGVAQAWGVSLMPGVTLLCAPGVATASGVVELLDRQLTATVGTAAAQGILAILGAKLVCAPGATAATGMHALLDCAINAGIANAAAQGVPVSMNAAQFLSCNPGSSAARGVTMLEDLIKQGNPAMAGAAGVAMLLGVDLYCGPGAATATGTNMNSAYLRTRPAMALAMGASIQEVIALHLTYPLADYSQNYPLVDYMQSQSLSDSVSYPLAGQI